VGKDVHLVLVHYVLEIMKIRSGQTDKREIEDSKVYAEDKRKCPWSMGKMLT
jgi:hypothetical protein